MRVRRAAIREIEAENKSPWTVTSGGSWRLFDAWGA
jgi:hypothetical protein